MLVIDTSAICAILLGEPEADRFKDAIATAIGTMMSAFSLLEAVVVLTARRGPAMRAAVMELVREADIEVVPFDEGLMAIAADAYQAFGKGRHPAALNIGDCCAYALARREAAPLICKGTDFALTDIVAAI